ncbi:ATP-binding protein [Brevundimonas sp.]|uniref:sensor histidine kinase n=1 Tax=Brevundimonas sp. TaxID=1871086 RepID=UPI001D88AE9C|nr:ATP-binding protein [Brevundimonas sp.]MBA3999977.1 histidine kinase [Brevundimonas sp.]
MILSRALADLDHPAVVAAEARAGSWRRGHDLMSQPHAPIFLAVILAFLVVLAVSTSRSAGLVAALWAAGGVAVTAWLRAGKGKAYDAAYAALIATGFAGGNLLAGNSPDLAFMFTIGNMIEVVLAVVLIRRFLPDLNIATVPGAAKFLILAAVIPPLPAALFASGMLYLMNGQDFLSTLQTWWFGHALGIAVFAPFGLAVTKRHFARLARPWHVAEAVVLLGGLAALVTVLFTQAVAPVQFIIVPLLLVIAVRLRIVGVTAGILITAIISISATLHGHGPMTALTGAGLTGQVMLAQLFTAATGLPMLLVAAMLEERDLFAARAAADKQKAEKASAGKSRLLANVAHEIKSPIGGIIGIGDLWSSGQLGPVTPTQGEMAGMLVKTARQIETLTHDLLDVARAESGAVQMDLRPVDVAGVVEDVRRTVALQKDAEGLALTAERDDDDLVALADSIRLSQVIGNLVTNAVKYGASGGMVMLRTRRVGRNIRVEVIDKGPGLSPDKQAQLFEPFNRLGLERSTIEGHGIGLTLAKRLTELQGGEIGVISAPGEGATFWIELPAA